MNRLDRRAFLGSALGGMATLFVGPGRAADPQPEVAPPPRPVELSPPASLGPQNTLFLTWQGDPCTTMTVQWLAPAGGPDSVRFAPLGGADWQQVATTTRPFPETDLKVYRAELTGLKPGTEYQFRLGEGETGGRFRTMPAKATDTITFVTGGDCGVNDHVVANHTLAARQEPYFCLIAGDLGYDNGRSVRAALGFVSQYARHMIDPKGRLIPLLTCLGNHEVRGGYKARRSDATFFFPLFDGLYRDTTYGVVDFGDYLSLVLLDTGHVSPIAGEQTDWLARTLKERAERPHLFVANHVPAYPSYRPVRFTPPAQADPDVDLSRIPPTAGTGEDNRRHWCPLFERFGVDIVLEHHDHTFKRTHPLKDGLRDKYGVTYLGDGSWGKLRTPVPLEARPYLAKVSKSYHFTVHKLEGETRYHVAIEEGGRVADVYSTTGKRPARRG